MINDYDHAMIVARKRKRTTKTSPLAKIKVYAKRIGPKGKKWIVITKKPHSSSYMRVKVYRDDFPQGTMGTKRMDRAIDKVYAFGDKVTGDDMWAGAASITFHSKRNMKNVKGYP